jgi:hypothetical protein
MSKRLPGFKYQFSVKTAVKFVLLTITGVVLVTCGFVSLSLIIALINTNANKIHPTSIPWIEEKTRCDQTGRIWRNGKCWDSEHSPLF